MTESQTKAGRPKHVPTDANRKLVLALAGYGAQQEYIASQIGIHQETLRIHYRKELDTAVESANAQVAQSLFKKAISDGTQSGTCAMFWMKTRAGWKETINNEHTGRDGGPIVTQSQPADLSGLSDDELASLAAIHSKLGGGK